MNTVSPQELANAMPHNPWIDLSEELALYALIGIALCDDGSGTWVVMRQDGEGNAEPVGDDLGAIVYTDILDAAEVLRTGIVWKHDMGEDPDADES